MRKVSLDSAQAGMVLAKSILGGAGQVLLNAGVKIKPQYLAYLRHLGINYFYVQDSRMEGVEINDVISEKTRHDARLLVENIMKNPSSFHKRGVNIIDKEIVKTVSKIVEELTGNKDVIVQLMDIRTRDDYLFAHSVNCCVLAGLVAIKMNYNTDTQKCLVTGTLLHDIGMLSVPANILEKSGELTEDEYTVVKNHPVYGYEILKNTPLFSARTGIVLLQHHERFAGQGYPQGLKGSKINPLAQIAGIADLYDALISDRPYRKAYQPHQAVEMLMSWGEEYFKMEILNHFLSIIAAYPVGSHVFLSNGESGLVIENNTGFTLRPVVRVLYTGEDLIPHPAPYDINLSQVFDLTIVRVLD